MSANRINQSQFSNMLQRRSEAIIRSSVQFARVMSTNAAPAAAGAAAPAAGAAKPAQPAFTKVEKRSSSLSHFS